MGKPSCEKVLLQVVRVQVGVIQAKLHGPEQPFIHGYASVWPLLSTVTFSRVFLQEMVS